MKMKLIFSSICFVVIASCNNSSEDKGKKEDSMAMDKSHEAMNHSQPSGEVPSIPEIPDGAKVFFKNLKDNATISSPFTLQMGADVMSIDSAGLVRPASGHHHLIIDGADSLAMGSIVPKDSVNIHFGNAQTEYELKLNPGKHKLTLQLADGLHRSYGGKLSASIMVTVK